ncbi:CMP/dCMP deaminase zinc-binding [Thiolapillus brandeum]|uniref:CMP/dCMP deaminase zinc-binding n=2 Tax=Thiolapillus brandeum TaxID=1076588 RepID=A0A7U6JI43_9GAMM|nr:CMP/dCMP deaminase zinc-binding [Thiolapillus brandeum]
MKNPVPMSVCFSLPNWVEAYLDSCKTAATDEARMSLVVEAARRNVLEGSGGPFAAAVFESGSGRLVSLGVNLVVPEGLSMLHAEMVAFSMAQHRLGTYDLGGPGMPSHELVTSTEPCAMCLGATCWSGVTRVVTAAADQDARAMGFDEGPKPVDWVAELARRGIEVKTRVLRDEALAVLETYRSMGGEIYNSRRG